MLDIINFINSDSVILMIFIFTRISGFFMFTPFFRNINIPMSLRISFMFYLTIIFTPTYTLAIGDINATLFLIIILSELLIGLFAGFILEIIFSALGIAGMQISNIIGFSMSSVMDPQSGINSPLISSFFMLIATMVLLSFDGHHLILLLLNQSFETIEIGTFLLDDKIFTYVIKHSAYVFTFGFMIAFPIIAVSLLMDIIFGMLMKTMPQFNLLVIGFPIKIAVSFTVISSILFSIFSIFKQEFIQYVSDLTQFFS